MELETLAWSEQGLNPQPHGGWAQLSLDPTTASTFGLGLGGAPWTARPSCSFEFDPLDSHTELTDSG